MHQVVTAREKGNTPMKSYYSKTSTEQSNDCILVSFSPSCLSEIVYLEIR